MTQQLNRAMKLFQSGLIAEAHEICEKLLQQDPRDSATLQLIGAIFIREGRYADAINALTDANFPPRREPSLHNNLGLANEYLGQMEEAERCFCTAIDIDSGFAAAYFNLSGVARLSLDDKHVNKLIKLLPTASERTPSDQALLFFAAGKAFADSQQYDKAFEYYRKANESNRPHYDRAVYSKQIDRSIDVFTSDLLSSRLGQGSDSELPVFLVGMPRTGSTLVEQILASHPQVAGKGEMPLIPTVAGKLYRHTDTDAEYPEVIHEIPQEVVQGYAKSYLHELERGVDNARRIVDKQLGNFAYLGLIKLMFPQAKVVHIFRDPLDTCLSCYFQRFVYGGEFSYSLEDLGHFYVDYRRVMEHWNEVMPNCLFHLEYKQLVSDQETVTRNLLDFLGLEWHEGCLEFYKTERAVSTASSYQVRQPLFRTALRRWQPYRQHLQPLIDILGDLAPADSLREL